METSSHSKLYEGRDPRDLPLYTLTTAARILSLSPATLRSWVAGRPYPRSDGKGWFEPLIQRPEKPDTRLSFLNLVEADVLAALRRVHDVPIAKLREAQLTAEKEFNIDRLFIREELRAKPGQVFLDIYGQLIDLSRPQQLAMRTILEGHLERVVHERGLAAQFWPVSPTQRDHSAKVIVLDPRISFGRPVVAKRSVTTAAIANRYSAGETVPALATDYGLEELEVEEAISFEQLAA